MTGRPHSPIRTQLNVGTQVNPSFSCKRAPTAGRSACVFWRIVVAVMSCVGTETLCGDTISASESQTEPWAESLEPNREPRPFEDGCFAGPESLDRAELPPAELRRWLEAVPGHPFHVQDDRVRKRAFCDFQGLAKLRAGWVSDAVLRLTPYKLEQLSIHVWSGNTGISFKYFRTRSPHLLAAYRTTRDDGQSSPESPGHLLTSDDGRYFRSNLGAFELRYQDESLVLSRGSIRLLTVPFAGVPEEVYLEGKFKLRDIFMYRSTPVPETEANARPVVLSSDEPAGLLRNIEPPDLGRLVPAADGSVELSTNADTSQDRGKTPLVWSGTLIAPRRLYEVIVLVEAAQPGTGVYLGNADLQPVHCVGFFRDRQDDRHVLWAHRQRDRGSFTEPGDCRGGDRSKTRAADLHGRNTVAPSCCRKWIGPCLDKCRWPSLGVGNGGFGASTAVRLQLNRSVRCSG